MSVKFENVSYTYLPGTPFASSALKNINLEINDHEFVALVGHTGSGKSTLSQLINALIRPQSGKITAGKFVIDAAEKKTKGLKGLKKYAAMVFQFPEYQLFEETVLKDVAFGPKNFGVSNEEALSEAKTALKMVGIGEELYESSPFELSGGQKRRVAIAGIIALKPDFLILDEATAGLDPQGVKSMMSLFKQLFDNGTSIIMVSHDMDIVLEYATRVLVLNEGKIVSDSTPEALFAKDDLSETYNIHEPKVIAFAKSLIKQGLKLDLSKIKNDETLVKEIIRSRKHG